MAILTAALVFISTVLLTIYLWLQYQFSYWQRKNIPHIPAKFFAGSLNDIVMFRECTAISLSKMYNNPAMVKEPIIGIHIFHMPGLLVKDLELIKRILVKDFYKFPNRYTFSDPHSDKLGGYNLFFVKTPIWKQIRTAVTPIFTMGKIKQMFVHVNEIGGQLDTYLRSQTVDPKTNSFTHEIKELCALFTTDVIASVAYGIQANSLKNPNGEFRTNGKRIFTFTTYRAIEFISFFFIPKLVSFFRFKAFSEETSKFLRKTIHYIMNEREKSCIQRNDLIDSLLMLKRSKPQNIDGKNVIKFEGDILVAQAAVFFTAGFETTSATMSFCLYELSKKLDIQKRLRDEIKEALEKGDGKITYDSINRMEYLEQIIQETLRMYPPIPFLDRECILNKNETGYSLEPIVNYQVPHGMPIYIPIYSIQRDEKYFPNPDEFDPERFSAENKQNIPTYAYLPFGIGPRNCIGERLGIMQVKIGLIYFLINHYVRASEKTPKRMQLNNKAMILQSEGGIHCDIVRDSLI